MEIWREELAILQAQLAVQHMALLALVHSHPHPVELLQHWRRLRADCVESAYALPADARASEWLSQHVQAFAEDWTAELVDAVTTHTDRSKASPSDQDLTMPQA